MYICVDLGGSNIRAAWTDDRGRSGSPIVLKRPPSLEGTQDVLLDLLRRAASQAPRPPVAVGVAAAGPLDVRAGMFLNPSNLPELHGFHICEFIQGHLGLPVALENDAQAAALGECTHGALAGIRDALVLTLGTGVGSGVIADGRIWRAGHQTGPELGHVYLGSALGVRCGCGQVGCAETWLQKAALQRLFRSHGLDFRSLPDLDPLIAAGDPRTAKALNIYGHRLGLLLSTLAVVFGYRHVGLSGGLSRLASHFLPATRKTLEWRLVRRSWLLPERIVPSPDPEMSALWGMAALLRERRQ